MFTTTTTEQQRLSKPFHKPVPNYWIALFKAYWPGCNSCKEAKLMWSFIWFFSSGCCQMRLIGLYDIPSIKSCLKWVVTQDLRSGSACLADICFNISLRTQGPWSLPWEIWTILTTTATLLLVKKKTHSVWNIAQKTNFTTLRSNGTKMKSIWINDKKTTELLTTEFLISELLATELSTTEISTTELSSTEL